MIAFRSELVPLVGDHAAVVVLSQIMYWHQGGRLRVRFRGKFWLAKSRAEMCHETKITLEQYKRVIPLLIKQGWIISERHLFNNKVTPFIRLTDKGRIYLHPKGEATKALVSEATNQSLVSDATNPLVSYATNPLTEITTESTETTTSVEDDAGGTDQKDQKPTGEEKSKIKIKGKDLPVKFVKGMDMKAKEILASHTQPINGNLGAYWKGLVAEVTGEHQHALTAKERGQLGHLSKYLGAETRQVMAYAVNSWWKFASEAGASAGTGFPGSPHLGFLLAHYQVALDLLHPPVPFTTVKEPPVTWTVSQPEKEEVYVPTAEELAKILAGED